ncbi:methyl-accepting chemotaxis protein [Shimia sp. R10_1]|uniref:methyl-accepting chemotaxis protein n=1 Tax=Shimia sp. R10_1 TaxID=2821095 RepID=UPI001ADAC37F|nr:methyl-accepting chemotaxis protein [Shimia sp. R10_1]MBO9473081.1 methyl-accepting chemotaxis protein [Shimia sp. R10_1]
MLRSRWFQILRKLNVLSSIRGKITFLLLTLMAVAFGAGYVNYQSFDRVDQSVRQMTDSDLPQLAQSNALIMSASHTKDAMIAVLVANTAAELGEAAQKVQKSGDELTQAVGALPEETKAGFEADLAQVLQRLKSSITARTSAFAHTEQSNMMIEALQQAGAELTGALLEIADDAYFDIVIQGEDTMASIDATLLDLVDTRFATLQALLDTRAEINFLTGVSLAMSTSKDRAMRSILSDLGISSHNRLKEALATLTGFEAGAPVAESLQEVSDGLLKAISAGLIGRGVPRDEVLSIRQRADAILVSAVDDMLFELTIAADDAATGNRDAIQGLLDNEVAFINALLEINSSLGVFQSEALKVVTAHTVEDALGKEKTMAAAAGKLASYRDFGDGSIAERIDKITAIAVPGEGLAALRIKSIQADEAASDAAHATVNAVLKIAGQASMLGLDSQETITTQAVALAGDASTVKEHLKLMGWAALALIGVALLLTHFLIIRPLDGISKTTERLSQGDMSPVAGFERASDEIARIATALKVFRDGLVEKEENARVADAEREKSRAEQMAAVDAIGTGLAKLSEGDLSYRIEAELTEGYAKLKDDFNTAAETLNETVQEVVSVAESIRNGSAEISQASDDLAHRTESQAATLEETASSIEVLTNSVKSAADGSQDAASTTENASEETAESRLVVESAVRAMQDIEASSSQIAQIIGVIDDIAFQTNLLALNAGVEAARAGDAGRGFAVVASEVRSLSHRTTDSASEIKALISKSTQQVEHGVELVAKTGEALRSISDRVGHISGLVSNIAQSSAEQASGLEEANKSVAHLDQVTQQNAVMVEETSAAGQLLSQNAEKLSGLMAHFAVSDAQDALDELAQQDDGSQWAAE